MEVGQKSAKHKNNNAWRKVAENSHPPRAIRATNVKGDAKMSAPRSVLVLTSDLSAVLAQAGSLVWAKVSRQPSTKSHA
jgi:hypothetical protein